MAKARGIGRKQVIGPLRKRFTPRPIRTKPPTDEQLREADREGAVWLRKKVKIRMYRTGRSMYRYRYVKTTPERDATARSLKDHRKHDFILEREVAESSTPQTRTPGRWFYGGLPGRYQRVFGTPEGKKFVRELVKRVKANAAKGRTTQLLDIGAGIAQYWIPVLRKLREHGDVELEVLNPSLVGKEHSPATQWHVGAIETKGFGRRQFDGVLCVYGGFDKSKHPIETLQKMVGLTKPGGIQYVVFGRKELGEGVPVTRGHIREALSLVAGSRIVTWKEPTGPLRHSKKAYRKDLMFVRGKG